MFEKECETEEVDDLPATQRFVSPQKSLATYHPDEACPVNILLCNSSSVFGSCEIHGPALIFRCFIDFGYLHIC